MSASFFPEVYLPMLFSIAAFVISVVSFFYFKSYLKRRTSQQRILSELQEEVNNIINSLDEVTERDITLIEEREKKLKSLLEEIDKRLRVYIRETTRLNTETAYADENLSRFISGSPKKASPARTEGIYTDLGKKRFNIAGQKPPQSSVQPSESAQPYLQAETGLAAKPAEESLRYTEPEQTAEPLPESVPPIQYSSSAEKSAPEPHNPAFPLPKFSVKESDAQTAKPSTSEQIRSLIQAGLAPPLIASRLGISIAEVEFAAALLERRDEK